jgi:hypothetical protein
LKTTCCCCCFCCLLHCCCCCQVDGRLLLSDRAHLLFDLHKEVDGAREAELAGGLRVPCLGVCLFSSSSNSIV